MTSRKAPLAGFSGTLKGQFSSGQTAWLGREDSDLDLGELDAMFCPANQFRDQRLSPIREIFPNRFPLTLLTNSKQLDFENRTKRAESRGSERNGRFGE